MAPTARTMENNRSIAMLKAAEEGGYGIPGIVSVRPAFN